MSTEQEAREAASRVECVELVDMTEDVRCIVMWATCELTRRDDDRAERGKPITAEWLESIGFYRDTTEGRYFEQQEIAGAFYLRNNGRLAWRCEVYELFEAETRGQLLDLLRVLRGGAT